ncbi:TIGR00300 family protein [Candidatus Bathyarchaeota archaeon]|nr:TIGR00300 family protein [Candidatus Bathyarchaeota archaeon]
MTNEVYSQIIEVQGHLIDSLILTKMLDVIMDQQGDFEILEFLIGKRKDEYSFARINVIGHNPGHLDTLLRDLFRLGATVPETPEIEFIPAPKDMVLPENFYSTTHHPTSIYFAKEWIEVQDMMMDKQIVIDPVMKTAICKPIAEIKKGDLIIVKDKGIKIKPPERPRGSLGVFEFMSSDISSEKPSLSIIQGIADDLYKTAKNGGKIIVVAGPAVIHTRAASYLARIIELGYVNGLLSGNALAVHDIEYALYGTSLGVYLDQRMKSREPRNHIAAINEVIKAGSIKSLIKNKKLNQGILYQLITNNIPYSLAGSIRDDGPLPEVIKDMTEAQRQYKKILKNAEFVMMFATTLHSIAVGNMLPSTTKVVCVDINPAVVTKLSDRGTSQAIGIVTDIGTFLPLLVEELEKKGKPSIN